ncbi:hypothetical protein PMAYCL1PPCAC_07733, partial [Pristionchus mayeri]
CSSHLNLGMSFRMRISIFVHFLLGLDLVDALITCNRAAGNVTLPSNECTGDVCLIRKDNGAVPFYYDCGEGAYFSHYPDGCYGKTSFLCVCRTSKCNVESFFSSSPKNANKPTITCNGADPNTTSTPEKCTNLHFCISYHASPINRFHCLDDPPTVLSFAPFLGLCYSFVYGSKGEAMKSVGSICICDTDYCSDGINTLPEDPERITVGNLTTFGVECFTDENQTATCRGDVCFIHRDTLSDKLERGCLISQRSAEARRLLYPSYTRDAFIDYYLCNTPQCNRNIASANASIAASSIATTLSPSGTTPDEWWTTKAGWTGWDNDTDYNDTEGNSTNGSTPKPNNGDVGQQYTLPFCFLLLLLTTLIIS